MVESFVLLCSESLAAQKDSEIAALQRRMQSGQQASLAEVQQLRNRLQQTQRSSDQIRQLTEENSKLTEQVGLVLDQCSNLFLISQKPVLGVIFKVQMD